ncbi:MULTISPECIES: arginine--tRNA ligase [Rossellomorea]|uniref:arginine--tRNA ligase n=1 Tax=Rossellomorea TaxID=2837508 RepID=UPI001CCBE04F|nr:MULTISPECIES: arginine--tRNA ligase [Rossellomorea]MCA0150282.1 arginine--tRNA ligase [Rossellomorea vietnamensis]WGG45906.1 arginine--tRNA ligase [Rossellomorea sp. DA94]
MDLKLIFAQELKTQLLQDWSEKELYDLIETPKHSHLGDLAFPCFQLAKTMRKAPAQIAKEMASAITSPLFTKVEAVGPYINIHFNGSKAGKEIVSGILAKGKDYGTHTFGKDRTVVLDMSSPNIAKPFSMGHLRSTVIGNAIATIAEKCGYRTEKINYIGDWGTQFGKLIVAFKKWGDPDKVKENPIAELFILYKKFHEEAELDASLEEEGRKAFKLLEDGDEEITGLWRWFKDESLQAFKTIYSLLGVEFDSYNGEAFFNDKMEEVVTLLQEHHLLEESQGAQVVRMDDGNLPPCLIKKSDGATLYATRDLAAALYRQRQYAFDEALYIVGQEQTIHFQQVMNVLKKLGYTWADEMKHIPFGLYLKDGKKMSTRKGRVILLEEVLHEAIKMAEDNIKQKNPDLKNAYRVARDVGVGAIIFHDLKNDRLNDIEFSLEHMLTFEGETGPYIQYTYARAQSLLRKAGQIDPLTFEGLEDAESWDVIKQLRLFPEMIEKSWQHYAPSIIAKYLIVTSQSFNRYYAKTKIISDDSQQNSRLALVHAVGIVLAEGLRLLGMKSPAEM